MKKFQQRQWCSTLVPCCIWENKPRREEPLVRLSGFYLAEERRSKLVLSESWRWKDEPQVFQHPDCYCCAHRHDQKSMCCFGILFQWWEVKAAIETGSAVTQFLFQICCFWSLKELPISKWPNANPWSCIIFVITKVMMNVLNCLFALFILTLYQDFCTVGVNHQVLCSYTK
jgi:hypothetical protein